MSEVLYVLYRKLKAFGASLCFYICRLFPIENNLISICTFEGKGGFGCNPKYLVQELHKRNDKLKFIWFVDDMDKLFPDYVTKVPNNVWSRAFWLTRSKIWIDNYRKPYGTVKRKGQYYLNVNHYTIAIKSTGLLRGKGFSKMAYLVSRNDSDMIDGLVIDSKWCEQCFDKAMVYNGKMLKTGAPRCDILYGDRDEYKKCFRLKHNLPEEGKIVMFAPTFREGANNGKRFVFSEVWTIDFERLITNFEKRFGGEWYVCIRVHPQLAKGFREYHNEKVDKKLIDESTHDDMYEILAGMDAYITDYSSAVFEAGAARIPAFIYADDIDDYRDSRGALLWDFNKNNRNHVHNNKEIFHDLDVEFPFSVALDNDQLEADISSFDYTEYYNKIDNLYEKSGLLFDGKASERLADIIISKMKE